MTVFIINYKFVLVILGSSIRVAMQALRPVVVGVCVGVCVCVCVCGERGQNGKNPKLAHAVCVCV